MAPQGTHDWLSVTSYLSWLFSNPLLLQGVGKIFIPLGNIYFLSCCKLGFIKNDNSHKHQLHQYAWGGEKVLKRFKTIKTTSSTPLSINATKQEASWRPRSSPRKSETKMQRFTFLFHPLLGNGKMTPPQQACLQRVVHQNSHIEYGGYRSEKHPGGQR